MDPRDSGARIALVAMLSRPCAMLHSFRLEWMTMLDDIDFDELNQQRLAALEARYRRASDAMNLADANYISLRAAVREDDLQLQRSLGKVQWLRGQLADLQEAMEMVREGACA